MGKKKTEKTVTDLKEIGPALDEKKAEELKAALAGPVIDTEAIKKLLDTKDVPVDATEAHKAYREKVKEAGALVESMYTKKGELKKTLNEMKGYSPAKEKILTDVREISKAIQEIYEKMPEVKDHVEYEFYVKRAESGQHFGHLRSILDDLVNTEKAEGYEGMTFHQAREKFPKTTIIMYGKAAYIIKGYKLGKALIELRNRAVTTAEARRAEEEKEVPKEETETK